MAFSPVTQGEGFTLTGRLVLNTGAPLGSGLGATLVIVFSPAHAEGNTRFQATGAATITDPNLDLYSFTPDLDDLSKLKPGAWQVQGVVTRADLTVRYSRPMPLRVDAAL
jgi:hypothetical protein